MGPVRMFSDCCIRPTRADNQHITKRADGVVRDCLQTRQRLSRCRCHLKGGQKLSANSPTIARVHSYVLMLLRAYTCFSCLEAGAWERNDPVVVLAFSRQKKMEQPAKTMRYEPLPSLWRMRSPHGLSPLCDPKNHMKLKLNTSILKFHSRRISIQKGPGGEARRILQTLGANLNADSSATHHRTLRLDVPDNP